MDDSKPIYVTQPLLPPLEEVTPYLEEIWASKWLTNGGQFHQRLERELAGFLGVEHLSLVSNATLGLIVALRALDLTGEVITTPYSFVATAHSLLWNNLKPVFVDVDPATCNLDPAKIEAAITPRTTAIMPVHCYGTPCDVDGIQRIADAHRLKVIYDAAHAFAVRAGGTSILNHGDMSVLSFHATKVFNTFEGGAVVCASAALKQRIDSLKNFGFTDETTVSELGINCKMNEFQAAMGLLQMKHVQPAIEARRRVAEIYREELGNLLGIKCLDVPSGVTANYSYFPILVGRGYSMSRDGLYEKLRDNKIIARRYFHPLITDMPAYAGSGHFPHAAEISEQVLCLPIYPTLGRDDLTRIIEIVRAA